MDLNEEDIKDYIEKIKKYNNDNNVDVENNIYKFHEIETEKQYVEVWQ